MANERRIAQFLTDVARDYDRLSNYARKVNRTTDDLHDAILYVVKAIDRDYHVKEGFTDMDLLVRHITVGVPGKRKELPVSEAVDVSLMAVPEDGVKEKAFREFLLAGLQKLVASRYGTDGMQYRNFVNYYLNPDILPEYRNIHHPYVGGVVHWLKTLGLDIAQAREEFEKLWTRYAS